MWNTIYTDGNVFATNEFLQLYNNHAGYLNEERFQRAAKIARLDLLETKLITVEDIEASDFTSYFFNNGEELSRLTLHHSFTHPVMSALKVSDASNLEGTVVQAFYRNNQLHGFRALPKEQ